MLVEGLAKIKVEGVFYNPRMKFCRDLDMVVFKLMPGKTYLDSLSATGVRGIRAKLEAGKEPFFNDISKKAVKVIKENLKINGIEAKVYCEEAGALMRKEKFDHVDVDPFGSPAPFIDPACFSAKKCMSFTATDTAALCGSAVKSCLRKYSCFVEKVEFYPEVGLRVLAGKIASEATKYDKAVEFFASWAKEHYYRIHVVVKRSPRLAAKIYENYGYLIYCKKCLYREYINIENKNNTKSCCPRCGEKLKVYGPMWLGNMKNAKGELSKVKKMDVDKKVKEFLIKLNEEIDVPFYYNVHEVCKRLKVSPKPVDEIIEKLKEMGFEASKTVLSGNGIRTSASIDVVEFLLQKF